MLNNIKGTFQIASYKFAEICNKIKIGLLKLKTCTYWTNFNHKDNSNILFLILFNVVGILYFPLLTTHIHFVYPKCLKIVMETMLRD